MFGVVVIVLAAIVWLLVTGGASPLRVARDEAGDVEVQAGSSPPPDVTLADIRRAEVARDGNQIVFEVRMARLIPRRVKGQTLQWRWELSEDGRETWILSANLDLGPNASIQSNETNYASSTIDDTMPGDIELQDELLVVRLNPQQVPGFPASFDWKVRTSLDADRADPASAVAEDGAPDIGLGEFGPAE